MAAPGRRRCARGARPALPRPRARARGALRQLGRAVRRSRPGRVDRPAQGDRALRQRARRAVPDLRDADDRGRDPPLLPRPRVGRARARARCRSCACASTRRSISGAPSTARRRRPPSSPTFLDVSPGCHPRRDPQRERALGARAAERRGRPRRLGLRRADRGARASTRSTRACCSRAASTTSPSASAQIVAMRFEEGLTQSQIAARIGISQMHVSRLLRRALAQLRARSATSTS